MIIYIYMCMCIDDWSEEGLQDGDYFPKRKQLAGDRGG